MACGKSSKNVFIPTSPPLSWGEEREKAEPIPSGLLLLLLPFLYLEVDRLALAYRSVPKRKGCVLPSGDLRSLPPTSLALSDLKEIMVGLKAKTGQVRLVLEKIV